MSIWGLQKYCIIWFTDYALSHFLARSQSYCHILLEKKPFSGLSTPTFALRLHLLAHFKTSLQFRHQQNQNEIYEKQKLFNWSFSHASKVVFWYVAAEEAGIIASVHHSDSDIIKPSHSTRIEEITS